jgi:hypothetical protein
VNQGDRVYCKTLDDTAKVIDTWSYKREVVTALVEFDHLTESCAGRCGGRVPLRRSMALWALEPAQDTLDLGGVA